MPKWMVRAAPSRVQFSLGWASGSDATPGWVCLGPEPAPPPSPPDCGLLADEDDVHRCGRCQAEFTALEDFVQHKLQKACQRAPQEALPATPAAALLGREVSPPNRLHRTQVCTHTSPPLI